MANRQRDTLAILRRYFGYDSFRDMQQEAIDNVLDGNDTFVLMPTGGGKSLCYQLPALMFEGITLVVSPLIALMKDQVDSLNESGVPATFLNSSIGSAESSRRLKAIFRGEYRLLYVAPERLMLEGFTEIVQNIPVSLIAVDEAHCISEWGHDFRPEYRRLREIRRLFPDVPVVALTATATEQVQLDIVRQLGMAQGKIFKASFVRHNLFYEVREKIDTYEQIERFVREHDGESGIIYCGSRRTTESLAQRLIASGFKAVAYHAGLSAGDRTERQEAFIRDNVQIICATIAFGMGIDKPNIRYVIHYDLPQNLEGYYQETGRAGRDGLESRCILFYSYGDKLRIDHFIEEKAPHRQEIARRQLTQVISFAESTVCRHRLVAEYFGEPYERDNCGMCDNCTQPIERFDATEMAQKFLSAVVRTGERFGAGHVIDVLMGSENRRVLNLRHTELSVYGVGSDSSRKEWMRLSRQLLSMGYLVQGEYSVLRLTEKAREILFDGERVYLRIVRERERMRPSRRSKSVEVLGAADGDLFQRLRRLRKRIADEHNVPPYVIFSDASLKDMAAVRPGTLEAFRSISGVGERKLEMYGEIFTREIRTFEAERAS